MSVRFENYFRLLLAVSVAGCASAEPTGYADSDPELASIPVADGFDFPFGSGDCSARMMSDYTVSTDYLDASYSTSILHTGEDWNRIGAGDTDFGDPVCATGGGMVVAAGAFNREGNAWGNVVVIKHHLAGGVARWTSYAHLGTTLVTVGALVSRGQQVGTVGRQPSAQGCDAATGRYCAHLHFEVRLVNAAPDAILAVASSVTVGSKYHDPTDHVDDTFSAQPGFIEANRPAAYWTIASQLGADTWSGNNAGSMSQYMLNSPLSGALGSVRVFAKWSGAGQTLTAQFSCYTGPSGTGTNSCPIPTPVSLSVGSSSVGEYIDFDFSAQNWLFDPTKFYILAVHNNNVCTAVMNNNCLAPEFLLRGTTQDVAPNVYFNGHGLTAPYFVVSRKR